VTALTAGQPGQPAPEPSTVLDFHVASKRYCSTSHPVPILSSSQACQHTTLQQWQTEGEQINDDPPPSRFYAVWPFCRNPLNQPGLGNGTRIYGYISWWLVVNPLIVALKPQSNGPPYSNRVIGTLAVDAWAVTFGTARRGLGGSVSRPGPSSLYQM